MLHGSYVVQCSVVVRLSAVDIWCRWLWLVCMWLSFGLARCWLMSYGAVVVCWWFSICWPHCIMVSFCGSACVGRIVWDSSRLLMWRSCWRHEFIWCLHWLSWQWYVWWWFIWVCLFWFRCGSECEAWLLMVQLWCTLLRPQLIWFSIGLSLAHIVEVFSHGSDLVQLRVDHGFLWCSGFTGGFRFVQVCYCCFLRVSGLH